MADKTIRVTPRSTAANTQYWDIRREDRAYLLQWLIRFMANMQEVCTADADLQRDYFRRRPGVYPRGRLGPNSRASMLGGIIDQLWSDRHPTSTHLDVLETLMREISDFYSEEGCEPVRFQRGLFE